MFSIQFFVISWLIYKIKNILFFSKTIFKKRDVIWKKKLINKDIHFLLFKNKWGIFNIVIEISFSLFLRSFFFLIPLMDLATHMKYWLIFVFFNEKKMFPLVKYLRKILFLIISTPPTHCVTFFVSIFIRLTNLYYNSK